MNAIIVDDEPNAISALTWELSKYEDKVNLVATYDNSEEAILALKRKSIDLVFLDIQMPGKSGIDLLKIFPQNRPFAVVMTTAHSEYTLEAIKNEVVDYLLKPIDDEDLYQAIVKAERFNEIQSKLATNHAQAVIPKSEVQNKLKIYHEGEILFLDTHKILCCESSGNYTYIHLDDKKLLVTKKLKELEESLPVNHFFRIHKSYLVNLDNVYSFSKHDNTVTLSNTQKYPVSRDRKQDFLKSIL